MRRLIVTGDDFGLSLPVNQAIEEAHSQGILNTASLMVGAPAAADAVARARRLADLKVGLHVVVVRGRALLPPEEISRLVDAQGNFASALAPAGLSFFFRPAVRRQLEAEIRAQFEAFRRTGLTLDHVNAHNHMHVHPTVLAMILRIGQDYGLRAVRLPYEPFLASWRASREGASRRLTAALFLSPWMGLMRRRLQRARMAHNDYLFGMNDTGRMGQERVLKLLAELPDGVSEMYFHPAARGAPDAQRSAEQPSCQQELEALTSPLVMQALRASGIRRAAFGDLAGGAR